MQPFELMVVMVEEERREGPEGGAGAIEHRLLVNTK